MSKRNQCCLKGPSIKNRMVNSIFLLALFLWASLSMASITTEVKPQTINYGKTFHLIITSDEQTAPIPNLRPLQNDFRIIGTERTMSYSVMNGQAKAIHQFIALLMPKHPGKLTIPALKVGSQTTKTQQIEVLEKGVRVNQNKSQSDIKSQATQHQEKVMIKTEVAPKAPYVSEQVTYTVKFYNGGRLLDAEYQPPQVENALMISLGDADRYQTTENGQSYVVEEQRYAIFPQKSGEINITGPSFRALAYDTIPKQINIPSKSTKLTIKPAPTDFDGEHWLIAKNIQLKEDYQGIPETIKLGDTITRTIEIEAVGVPAQLLPSLTFKENNAFNVYPEKPELSNTIQQNELVGRYTISVVYLLNAPGKITLPEIKIPWFNSTTGKTSVATLPSKGISVTGAAKSVAINPSQDNQTVAVNTAKTTTSLVDAPLLNVRKSTPLAWVLGLVFGVAWILTLLMWWFKPIFVTSNKRRLAIKTLHEACFRNDPVATRKALLNWASYHWPEEGFVDLNDISKRIPDSAFKQQVNELSKALFSKEKNAWHGSDFWLAIASFRKNKPKKQDKKNDLPPMNP
jgi:hypothetical protein